MNHFDYTGYFEKVAADMPALVGKSILPGGYETNLPGKAINAYHRNPKAAKGALAGATGLAAAFAGKKGLNAIRANKRSAQMSSLGLGAAGAAAGAGLGYMAGKSQQTKQASEDLGYAGCFDKVAANVMGTLGKSTFNLFGSKITTDAPGRIMRYAQANPMSAMGRAAGAGALGTWAISK